MPKIRLLDEDTVNKIAAGEVIERPASVVKELAENSIDAGATRVLVEIADGGKSLIRVTDDGCGMSPEDLSLAFQKHATSKISGAEDLGRITTLGFRGEALSSISSVARSVEVSTKTKSALTGTYMRVESGNAVEIKEIGCPKGTSISVKGLFQNVPARLKYLKAPSSELARIVDVVTEMAVINYSVSFELFSGRRTLFRSNRSQSWDGCLLRIMGLETVRSLVPIESQEKDFSIKGSIASQLHTRSSPDWIFAYVNGRPVSSKMISNSLKEAYRGLIPSGRSPIGVIAMEIDPRMIDVNVHPTKREIRFLREEEASQALIRCASEALRSRSPEARQVKEEVRPLPLCARKITSADAQRTLPLAAEATVTLPRENLDQVQAEAMLASPEDAPKPQPRLNILGQVLNLYIVAEGEEGLMIIDQHAAAERIRYERLQERFMAKKISQELVDPVNIELSPKEVLLLDSWSEILEEMGFEISHFGGATYNVRALPALGHKIESPEAIHDILRDLFALGKVSPDSVIKDDVLKLLACRGSIKSGHKMSMPEMKALVKELYSCQNPNTCPHGRPVSALIDMAKLDKIFGR